MALTVNTGNLTERHDMVCAVACWTMHPPTDGNTKAGYLLNAYSTYPSE